MSLDSNKISSSSSELKNPPFDQTRLLMENVLETCTDEMVRLYILIIANYNLDETFKIEETRRNRRRIMIKFSKEYSFDECVARQKKLPELCGSAITFRKMYEPDTVRVTNLADTCTKEVLNLYFSNTKVSSGGDIKSIKIFTAMSKALIRFQDYRIIKDVLSQTHIICEKQVKLEKYWGPIEDEYLMEEEELELNGSTSDLKQDLLETTKDKMKKKSMALMTSLKAFNTQNASIDKTKLIISNIPENINIQHLELYINLLSNKNEIKEINWSLDFKGKILIEFKKETDINKILDEFNSKGLNNLNGNETFSLLIFIAEILTKTYFIFKYFNFMKICC
jgi:hypothetical protein